MSKDGLRGALALIAAKMTGDEEGQRVIRENADPEALIDGFLLACDVSLRLMAKIDRVTVDEAVEQLQTALRTI